MRCRSLPRRRTRRSVRCVERGLAQARAREASAAHGRGAVPSRRAARDAPRRGTLGLATDRACVESNLARKGLWRSGADRRRRRAGAPARCHRSARHGPAHRRRAAPRRAGLRRDRLGLLALARASGGPTSDTSPSPSRRWPPTWAGVRAAGRPPSSPGRSTRFAWRPSGRGSTTPAWARRASTPSASSTAGSAASPPGRPSRATGLHRPRRLAPRAARSGARHLRQLGRDAGASSGTARRLLVYLEAERFAGPALAADHRRAPPHDPRHHRGQALPPASDPAPRRRGGDAGDQSLRARQRRAGRAARGLHPRRPPPRRICGPDVTGAVRAMDRGQHTRWDRVSLEENAPARLPAQRPAGGLPTRRTRCDRPGQSVRWAGAGVAIRPGQFTRWATEKRLQMRLGRLPESEEVREDQSGQGLQAPRLKRRDHGLLLASSRTTWLPRWARRLTSENPPRRCTPTVVGELAPRCPPQLDDPPIEAAGEVASAAAIAGTGVSQPPLGGLTPARGGGREPSSWRRDRTTKGQTGSRALSAASHEPPPSLSGRRPAVARHEASEEPASEASAPPGGRSRADACRAPSAASSTSRAYPGCPPLSRGRRSERSARPSGTPGWRR